MAGSLSGGEQQMLAIGRALMGNPRVLLMDEPSEGLAPQLVAEVGRTIAQLKAEGLSIVLVEQNIKLTLDLADDVVIINTGRVAFNGRADEVKDDHALIAQQLGVFLRNDVELATAHDRLEQVRAHRRAQARQARPRNPAAKRHHRHPFACRGSGRRRLCRAAECAAIPACTTSSRPEVAAVNAKQDADMKHPHRRIRAAAAQSRRHGHRHAGDQAAARPVLLHAAGRDRGEGGADGQ